MLHTIFSAKFLAVVMAMALTASTVGIYAAAIGTSTQKRLGATGDQTVASPTNAVVNGWTLNTSGNVSHVNVTWTPAANSTYTVYAYVTEDNSGGDCNAETFSGSQTVTNSGTSQITTSVSLSSPVNPYCIGTNGIKVNIVES